VAAEGNERTLCDHVCLCKLLLPLQLWSFLQPNACVFSYCWWFIDE
jgi:hypothetical protein